MGGSFFNPEINLRCCEYILVSDWNIPNLAGPFWRFYHNDENTAGMDFDGRHYKLTPDCFYLVAPETAAATHLTAPFHQLYLHFTARFPYDCPPPGIYAFPAEPAELTLIGRLKTAIRTGRGAAPETVLTAQALCLLGLARVPETALETPITDSRILKTVKYIQSHYAEKITNRQLAVMAAMNPNAFIRCFGDNVGMAPQQYVTDYRLRQACLRLHYSEDSIDEIAEQTGFCNRFYFSAVFRRRRGLGPARFRQQSRAELGGKGTTERGTVR